MCTNNKNLWADKYCDSQWQSSYLLRHIHRRFQKFSNILRLTETNWRVAERLNWAVLETARTMITESGLPKDIWGEAVLTTTCLIHRSPTAAMKKTLAYIWFGIKPNVYKLIVFECQAYCNLPKENRSKFDPKSEAMVMIGYALDGCGMPRKKKL